MEQDNKQPIRVLEVFGRMNRGGAESMIMNLYRKMDKSRVQLDFMVHTEKHCQFDDEIEQMGGLIYHVPRFRVYNFFSYRRAWRRFFQMHPEYRVVHGHMGATAAIYLHEANRVGCFTIAHSHSADNPRLTLYDLLYAIFSWPTRYVAKQLFGCSTEAGVNRYGRKAAASLKYRNFPNAIDLKRFEYRISEREKYRKELGIGSNQLAIIHVGRVTSPKNPAMIFRVFKELVKMDPKAKCYWVGTGELEDKYKRMIEEEHLEDRICMTGVRSDIPGLLMAADCFLFPSLWEGLPVSVIEAQATGIPCVISDAISREVAVSDLVEWHSLSESPELWADRCLTLARKSLQHRQSCTEVIRKAGYDIEDSVRWLTDFYESHHNQE